MQATLPMDIFLNDIVQSKREAVSLSDGSEENHVCFKVDNAKTHQIPVSSDRSLFLGLRQVKSEPTLFTTIYPSASADVSVSVANLSPRSTCRRNESFASVDANIHRVNMMQSAYRNASWSRWSAEDIKLPPAAPAAPPTHGRKHPSISMSPLSAVRSSNNSNNEILLQELSLSRWECKSSRTSGLMDSTNSMMVDRAPSNPRNSPTQKRMGLASTSTETTPRTTTPFAVVVDNNKRLLPHQQQQQEESLSTPLTTPPTVKSTLLRVNSLSCVTASTALSCRRCRRRGRSIGMMILPPLRNLSGDVDFCENDDDGSDEELMDIQSIFNHALDSDTDNDDDLDDNDDDDDDEEFILQDDDSSSCSSSSSSCSEE